MSRPHRTAGRLNAEIDIKGNAGRVSVMPAP
jgi:hypothetical protein